MTTDLFRRYSAAAREAYAKGLQCDVGAFEREELTIVARPDSVPWFTALAATFGTGTVLCIDPGYRDFAETNRPKKHYQAMSTSFLATIAAEGERRGVKLLFWSPSLCFTIAEEPPVVEVPRGFELREHDAAWMHAEQANNRFENGVGEPGRDGREFRNRFALGLYDEQGEPAAVAGAFDTYGMLEIGVDVARGQRGLQLGRLVVSAMAREIMRRGEVPFYGCGTTNIRSHLTAESCGFRAVLSDVTVSAPM
jgi:hypothetical protein